MINEIFRELSEVRERPRNRAELIEYNKKTAQAKTAIYEIGLECIGADEDVTATSAITVLENGEPKEVINFPIVRNELRASQRKAWAKACGVKDV